MKRIAVLILSAVLLTTLAGGVDAKKKPRRVSRQATANYDTPAPGLSGGPWAGNCGSPSTGCTVFGTGAGESYASFVIEDASGQATSGSVWRGSGTNLELLAQFCGETTEPVQIPAGESITVTAHTGPSPSNTCPGVATSGAVTATFSNLP